MNMAKQSHPLHRAYTAYGMRPPGNSVNDNAPEMQPNQDNQSDYQISVLNIPAEEATPAVRSAVSMMFRKLEEMKQGLDKAKDHIRKLEERVDVDYITNLPNRRAFFNKLEWSISMFERYKHHFSVIYIDMDDLKLVNDQMGHTAGDMAIRHVGAIVEDIKRDTDFLARVGSDEFALIMHYADETAARKRAEDITQRILNSHFMYQGQTATLTASHGVYEAKPRDTADMIVQRADIAMRNEKSVSQKTLRTELTV